MATTYAIPDGRVAMAATTYAGTGASASISNAVNGVSFQPDLVWIKDRTAASSHQLYDRNRGTTSALSSNLTNAEYTVATGLTAFNSNGFTVVSDSGVNLSGRNYVGWQWKAGGTAVSNTAGSVTSQVSANVSAGFSVATYTAPSGTFTFGHGLGVTPNFVIIKRRDSTSNWNVWTTGFTARQSVYLDATNGADSSGADWFAVNSSTVQITTGQFTAAGNFVAYCFAAVPGYSAFGSAVGNGSADGVFVYTGFLPRFILWKKSSSTGDWRIWDSSRSPYDAAQKVLYPNASDAEYDPNNGTTNIDFLSNGFKFRSANLNESGATYIYACFAENPFKYANAR